MRKQPISGAAPTLEATVSPTWQIAARAADSKKATDVRILDLREVTTFADHFVICTGSSSRQTRAIWDEIVLQIKQQAGERAINVEGYDNGEWVLGDFGDLVLGLASVPYFRPQSYYDSAAWRGTWSLDGGGALMNQGIHVVDLLLWLMGGEVEVVGASGGTVAHDIEVEDCVVAALRFSNGARGSIVATTAAAPGFPHRIDIYGTRSGATIDGDAAGASPTGIGTLGHTILSRDFVASIREGRDPLVDGVEGRRSLAAGAIDDYVDHADTKLAAANGDGAQLARQSGLVDHVSTRPEILVRLRALAGKGGDERDYGYVELREYLEIGRAHV